MTKKRTNNNRRLDDTNKKYVNPKSGKRANSNSDKFHTSSYDNRDSGSEPRGVRKDGSDNDIAWYVNSEQLLRDSASLSFNNALGMPISAVPTMPGILVLEFDPAFGPSDGEQSYILDRAALNFYSFVRHANSGHSNYEAADLMMYLLAMDSVYSLHAWMTRVYGVAMLYSQTNRYYPVRLLEAMGCNASDIISHLSDLRYFINQFTTRIGSLCVPANISYYARHVWMNSNLYLDEESSKGQVYMYNQRSYFQFAATAETTGSALKPRRFERGKITFDAIMQMADTLATSLITDEDINIMSGDILKAYGQDGVVKLGTVPTDYVVMPVYNKEVLSQMHNATIVDIEQYGVTQSNGSIRCTVKIAGQAPVFGYLKQATFLDLFWNDPSPADVMISSRLKVMTDLSDPESSTINIFGSEIVVNAYMYNMHSYKAFNTVEVYTDSTVDKVKSMYEVISDLTTFEKAPYFAPSMRGVTTERSIGSYNNYTTLDRDTLMKLHTTAMLNMFTVPLYGKVQ